VISRPGHLELFIGGEGRSTGTITIEQHLEWSQLLLGYFVQHHK